MTRAEELDTPRTLCSRREGRSSCGVRSNAARGFPTFLAKGFPISNFISVVVSCGRWHQRCAAFANFTPFFYLVGSWCSYQCQWEDDKALDSKEEGSRSIHYRADGTERTVQGDELRSLMRRINEQRMMVSGLPD